uniref:DUF4860 domain-containing protein n=1 Tax=Eubacterium cellulosolvens TaxID=29322 RepID=UPI0006877962|nr:DUF4860 domain-containing protein [[Eubacterium] cellulosolvens]
MKSHLQMNPGRFSIVTVFPIILFCFFAFTGISVVMYGARVYETTIHKSTLDYSARTAIAYMTEKIRQNDTCGSVELGNFENCKALVLTPREALDDTSVRTYIYFYEDNLCELTTTDPSSVHPAAGTHILPLKDVSLDFLSDDLLHFKCVDNWGNEAETCIALLSQEVDS